MVIVLMFAGLRSGELLALKWKHIDFENSTLSIEGAVTTESDYDENGKLLKRESLVASTKTVSGVRKIKVCSAVIDALKEWRYYQAIKEHKTKKVLLKPDGFVFLNNRGEMRKYSGFRSMFRRFVEENNFDQYDIHPHTLRHTFATMLLEAGINPKVVQELLGHKDVETTLGTYSHVMKEVLDSVATKVDDIYLNIMSEETKENRIKLSV